MCKAWTDTSDAAIDITVATAVSCSQCSPRLVNDTDTEKPAPRARECCFTCRALLAGSPLKCVRPVLVAQYARRVEPQRARPGGVRCRRDSRARPAWPAASEKERAHRCAGGASVSPGHFCARRPRGSTTAAVGAEFCSRRVASLAQRITFAFRCDIISLLFCFSVKRENTVSP